MSRTRPKERRRGGARDDSELYVGYTRRELLEMLERTKRKCAAIHYNEQQRCLPPALRDKRR